MKNFYETLEIPKNATDAQIKAAYRKLALKWHPDKNKSSDAGEKFKTINQAYETLSDPKKKQMYDQYGHDAYTRQGATSQGNPNAGYGGQQGPFQYTYTSNGGNPFEGFDFGGGSVDPFDIFESFFGFQGGRPGGRQQARRQIYQIEIGFMEAVKGVTKEVGINGKNKTIKIPAGVDNGNRIRFADFDLQIAVRPDKNFKREGQDLIVEQNLSFSRAILGGEIDVPTIDGSLKVKVKSGTQPNSMLRLKGKGVPYPNSSRVGDQYIVFKIKIPDRISGKQKKALEEFERN